jgi:hypothetical protein
MSAKPKFLPEISKIIAELKDSSEQENNYFFEYKKQSEEPIAYFQKIVDDPNTSDFNRNAAMLLIAHEHQFLELIAGRRMLEFSLLDALTDLSQALTNLDNRTKQDGARLC